MSSGSSPCLSAVKVVIPKGRARARRSVLADARVMPNAGMPVPTTFAFVRRVRVGVEGAFALNGFAFIGRVNEVGHRIIFVPRGNDTFPRDGVRKGAIRKRDVVVTMHKALAGSHVGKEAQDWRPRRRWHSDEEK